MMMNRSKLWRLQTKKPKRLTVKFYSLVQSPVEEKFIKRS